MAKNEGGKKIKWVRQMLGMSIIEFTQELGLKSRSTIYKCERGIALPGWRTIEKILRVAKKYNIEVTAEELRPYK